MKTSLLCLRPGEPANQWVARTVHGLIAPVVRRARQPHRGQEETIHLIRTTTKQLRALLRLLRTAISPATFTEEDARLKNAADRLAPGRDRAVARETMAMLAKAADSNNHRKTLTRLRRELDKLLPLSTAPDAARTVLQSARSLDESKGILLQIGITNGGWNVIGAGLVAAYRRARRRLKAASDHADDESLHRWRIAVKRLYYQLRWLEPVWPERFISLIKRLHELEQKLGTDHDLALLQASQRSWARGISDAATADVLRKAIRQRRLRLKSRCLALGKKELSQTPQAFEKQCRRHWKKWSEAPLGPAMPQ